MTSSKTTNQEGIRLNKALAQAGVGSRRGVEAIIEAGRVAVNNKKVTDLATRVTDDDLITVDGKPVEHTPDARLWLYHKPAGLVTTHKDPEGRDTVFDNLPPDMPRVISVGRLDLNTEGLLLLTNSGDLARHFEHPKHAFKRVYRVRVRGIVKPEKLDKLKDGITLDGIRYAPVDIMLERQMPTNAWLVITITEGKNREVRKICEHLGHTVSRLIRVQFGPYQLGELKAGTAKEIKNIKIKSQS